MRYISVFSGIEAASVAFQPLGMEPVAFAEVDKHASAVLAAHYPDVPNLGDVTKIDWKKYRGKADLVVGGSPCQSFSIAGKREGLEGESGLMYEFIRCVREVRPRWFIWENVPGALSSEHGAAFGQLLHEMADGGGYGCAWRVLDAQFFGVAQRRRRLFLVGRAGNGYREACQVLFEPDCVPGNSASSRAKRAELAARAGNGAQGAGFGDAAVIALQSDGSTSTGSNGSGFSNDGSAYTLNRVDRQSVAIAANQRGEVRLDGGDGQTIGAIPATRSGKQLQGVLTPWDVQSKRVYSQDACGPTLPSGTREGVNIQPSVLCMASGQANAEVGEDVGTTLSARQYKDPPIICGETVGALCARDYKGVGNEYVSEGKVVANAQAGGAGPRYVVRRLTSVECERLQGFPDGWTDVPDFDGKPMSDAQRYKQLGNSMAVPVMRWIGKRILMVDEEEGSNDAD
jgi:DNA (cytosine-5)-methyltransferase 1